MPNLLLTSFEKIFFKNKLKFLELIFLSLFLMFLPSLEAPKNIFLVGYLIVAIYRQSQSPSFKYNTWDWVFLSLIFSSFLTALFPGISGGYEWKGFRAMLLWITFGWAISRSDYNFQEKKYFFIFSILMTLPPLLWAILELFILHTKEALQLHSVGHVNHSAIYLCMIFGSSLILFFTHIETHKRKCLLFSALLCIFLLVTIIASQSRGAFGIALLLAFLILLLSKLTIKIKTIFSVIFIIFIIGFLSIKTAPIISKQLNNMNSHDIFGVGERFKVWNAAFKISGLNPFLGIGGGNWDLVEIDQIRTLVESRGEIFNAEDFALQFHHPHNIYLSNLIDRGIFGLIIFLNFMFIWLITIIKSYKKFNQDSEGMLFIMGSFSAWVTIFGIGLVNTTFHHENALLALFFLGLHLSYLRQKNQLKLFK